MSAESKIRQRHQDLTPEPMFDAPERRAPEPKPKAPRAVDQVTCPTCGHKVGVYVLRMDGMNRVLAYRRHFRTTRGGARFECRLSDTEASADVLDDPAH